MNALQRRTVRKRTRDGVFGVIGGLAASAVMAQWPVINAAWGPVLGAALPWLLLVAYSTARQRGWLVIGPEFGEVWDEHRAPACENCGAEGVALGTSPAGDELCARCLDAAAMFDVDPVIR